MKKTIALLFIATMFIACAALQAQEPQPAKANATDQASAHDKIQARLKALEPLAKEALENVKKTPQWAAYEVQRKESDAAGKLVEATPEWKRFRAVQVEQEYLLKLSK